MPRAPGNKGDGWKIKAFLLVRCLHITIKYVLITGESCGFLGRGSVAALCPPRETFGGGIQS